MNDVRKTATLGKALFALVNDYMFKRFRQECYNEHNSVKKYVLKEIIQAYMNSCTEIFTKSKITLVLSAWRRSKRGVCPPMRAK